MDTMIKMIMSDMDGTLLDNEGRMPAGFDAMIGELRRRDVLFVPASGRQYYALLREMGKYADDFIFLAENGTYVKYRGQEVFSSPMKWTKIHELLELAESLDGVYPVLCGKKQAYVQPRWKPYIGEAEMYFPRYEFVEDFSHIDDDIIKAAFCDCERAEAEKTIYPAFKEHFGKEFQVALSSNYWVDAKNLGINKGVAVEKIQEWMGIEPEECACFGDYLNDEQMMHSVYYSYAMANAHPKIKEAARFTAKSNEEHGVLLAIQDMMEQGLL